MNRNDYGEQRRGQYSGQYGGTGGDDWRTGGGPRNNFDEVDRRSWRAQDGDYPPSQAGSQSYGGQNYDSQGSGGRWFSGQYGSQGTPGRGYGAPDPGSQGYGDRPWGMQGHGEQGQRAQGQRGQQVGIGNAANRGFPGSNFPDEDMRDQGWSGGPRMPQGQHTGKGPKGYQRSDDRIHEDVSDRLAEHGDIDASELEVQVSNGEVTLSGFVDDRRQKRLAEDVAEQAAGVKDVHNQLRVHDHGQMPSSGESESTTNGRAMARNR